MVHLTASFQNYYSPFLGILAPSIGVTPNYGENYLYTLTIQGRLNNNNTRIQCGHVLSEDILYSEETFIFRVFGKIISVCPLSFMTIFSYKRFHSIVTESCFKVWKNRLSVHWKVVIVASTILVNSKGIHHHQYKLKSVLASLSTAKKPEDFILQHWLLFTELCLYK